MKQRRTKRSGRRRCERPAHIQHRAEVKQRFQALYPGMELVWRGGVLFVYNGVEYVEVPNAPRVPKPGRPVVGLEMVENHW